MSKPLVTILGKTVKHIAKLRGGGSALPGLVVERIDPQFIKRTLAGLPLGVVVISGTNGKTTTTKMVVELLESQGLRVFTNRTGSNFTRGVAAALLGEVNLRGELAADIAVLELDEAHAVHFVDAIPPRHSLILNVMRDQLDRFGEIDHTAGLLRHIAIKTTDSVVLNREDPQIADIAKSLTNQKVDYFGLSDNLRSLFPNDDELHAKTTKSSRIVPAGVVLDNFDDRFATFVVGDQTLQTSLKISGIYNIYNAAAAIALVHSIVGKNLNQSRLIKTLSSITPAFGRGETIIIDGQPVDLVLVKNPAGFRLGLQSFNPDHHATMIAINDNYADGRDMSWLWDVNFASLTEYGVAQVAGSRAYDMALRLQYDDVPFSHVDTNLKRALKHFLIVNQHQPKRIYCTYTAMLTIRRLLAKLTDVEVAIK